MPAMPSSTRDIVGVSVTTHSQCSAYYFLVAVAANRDMHGCLPAASATAMPGAVSFVHPLTGSVPCSGLRAHVKDNQWWW